MSPGCAEGQIDSERRSVAGTVRGLSAVALRRESYKAHRGGQAGEKVRSEETRTKAVLTAARADGRRATQLRTGWVVSSLPQTGLRVTETSRTLVTPVALTFIRTNGDDPLLTAGPCNQGRRGQSEEEPGLMSGERMVPGLTLWSQGPQD